MLRSTLIALAVVTAGAFDRSSPQDAAPDARRQAVVSDTTSSSKRMADDHEWTTDNLKVRVDQSYCYDDTEWNCGRYGRLYTWEAAQQGCRLLGDGWRLPTNDEWQQLAKHYDGVADDSSDGAAAAYKALTIGGNSGFRALLGGGRDLSDNHYGRLEAHGFYWTASESDPGNACFYNFANGRLALFRQRSGEKQRAFSVQCIRK